MKVFDFFRQVQDEVSKITWPAKSEVMMTFWFVLAMSFFAAVFFLITDRLILQAIKWLLSLGDAA